MGPEVCSLDYVTDYIPEESPVTDIVVSKGSVSNNNTGEEGSGLGDVGNKVFVDVDIALSFITEKKGFLSTITLASN